MTAEALAGSYKSFWPSAVRDHVIKRFGGKFLHCRNQGEAFEQLQKRRIRSFARRAERTASDLFGLRDLFVLVFACRRLWIHGRHFNGKRNRIALNVLCGDEGRLFLGRGVTAKTIKTEA